MTSDVTTKDVLDFVSGGSFPVSDYLRRMWLVRQPVPEMFIEKLPKAGQEFDFYSWATVAEFMDAVFPGSWDFFIKNIQYNPIETTNKSANGSNGGFTTFYEILATVSVSIDGTAWDMPTRTRENVGQHYSHEYTKSKGWIPNEKGAETATHAAFRRACAMFGPGRNLYLRDKKSGEPATFSIADLMGIRAMVMLGGFDLINRTSKLILEGKPIKDDRVIDILETISNIGFCPNVLTNDEVTDPLAASKAALEAWNVFLQRVEEK